MDGIFPFEFPSNQGSPRPQCLQSPYCSCSPTPDVGGRGGGSCQDQAGSSRPADLQGAPGGRSPLAWEVGGLQFRTELGREARSRDVPFLVASLSCPPQHRCLHYFPWAPNHPPISIQAVAPLSSLFLCRCGTSSPGTQPGWMDAAALFFSRSPIPPTAHLVVKIRAFHQDCPATVLVIYC